MAGDRGSAVSITVSSPSAALGEASAPFSVWASDTTSASRTSLPC